LNKRIEPVLRACVPLRF